MHLLGDTYPGTSHVSLAGFILVSKDADFSEMSMLLGSPPKVIWLQLGNCTTETLEQVLRNQQQAIKDLVADPSLRVLRLPHP